MELVLGLFLCSVLALLILIPNEVLKVGCLIITILALGWVAWWSFILLLMML